MNLLDKLTHSIKPGLALLLIPFFFACNDPTQLGLEINSDQSEVGVNKIELTLPTSTVYIDSLRTDNYTSVILGAYEDSIIGKVTATPYCQYEIYTGVLSGTDELGQDTLKFEYADILLKVSDQRAHGTLSNQKISVHEINDKIYSQPAYLSNRVLDYDPDPIGEHTFDFNPETDSVIDIRLNEDFGMKIFERLSKAGDTSLTDYLVYRDSLLRGLYQDPPLAFVPDPANSGLFQINLKDDTTKLAIRMSSVLHPGKSYVFLYTLNAAHYTQITRDRSSGKLADLVEEYSPSTIPSSRSYLDLIAGVYPKVSLSPLIDFIDTTQNIIINRATLRYGLPTINNQPYVYEIPFLWNFLIHSNGRINGGAIFNLQTKDGYHNGILVDSDYFQILSNGTYVGYRNFLTMQYDTTHYSGDATMFIQLMSSLSKNGGDLLAEDFIINGDLIPPSGYNIDPFYLGQTSFVNSEIKLTLYYTTEK